MDRLIATSVLTNLGLVVGLLMIVSACGAEVPTVTPPPFQLPPPRAGAPACRTVEGEREFVAGLARDGIVVTAISSSTGEALFPNARSVCLMDVGSVAFEVAFFADVVSALGVHICEGPNGDRRFYRVEGQTVDAARPIYWSIAGNAVVWTGSMELDGSLTQALGGSRPRC
jgi:hypothetical protein